MNNKDLRAWFWKWHFIGGLISLPFVLLLATTGTIYLFKDDYEASDLASYKAVEVTGDPVSLQEQWEAVKGSWDRTPTAMVVPETDTEATEFVSGRFSHKSSVFIDPYSMKTTGYHVLEQTDMHKVRKLHGELLMGPLGTKIIELVASWVVVLLITGVIIFWPKNQGWNGFFRIRTNGSKRLMYRDLHAVTGFWFSLILLLILAGGLPWTDVFGSSFKWFHDTTNTGFPAQWQGWMFQSEIATEPLSLDQMVAKARELNLPGEVSVALPQSPEAVFSVSNETSQLASLSMYHFDQYNGELLYRGTWEDIGIMMKARLWAMAFHQGQLGTWNLILILITAAALTMVCISALLSYLHRKRKGSWSIPSVPDSFMPNSILVALIVLLGILLPLFGLSAILIWILEKLKSRLIPGSNIEVVQTQK